MFLYVSILYVIKLLFFPFLKHIFSLQFFLYILILFIYFERIDFLILWFKSMKS